MHYYFSLYISSIIIIYNFVYNILLSSLMFVYRSREIPLRFNSSSSTAATCIRVSECPVSTKPFQPNL